MSGSRQLPQDLSDEALLTISAHVFRSIHVTRQTHLTLGRGFAYWCGLVRKRRVLRTGLRRMQRRCEAETLRRWCSNVRAAVQDREYSAAVSKMAKWEQQVTTSTVATQGELQVARSQRDALVLANHKLEVELAAARSAAQSEASAADAAVAAHTAALAREKRIANTAAAERRRIRAELESQRESHRALTRGAIQREPESVDVDAGLFDGLGNSEVVVAELQPGRRIAATVIQRHWREYKHWRDLGALLQAHRKQKKRLQARLSTETETTTMLLAEVAQLRDAVHSADATNSTLASSETQLQGLLQSASAERNDLEARCLSLQETVDTLQASLSVSETASASASSELEQVRSEYARLEAEKQEIERYKAQVVSEVTELTLKVQNVDATNSSLVASETELRNLFQSTSAERDDLETRCLSLRETVDTLQASLEVSNRAEAVDHRWDIAHGDEEQDSHSISSHSSSPATVADRRQHGSYTSSCDSNGEEQAEKEEETEKEQRHDLLVEVQGKGHEEMRGDNLKDALQALRDTHAKEVENLREKMRSLTAAAESTDELRVELGEMRQDMAATRAMRLQLAVLREQLQQRAEEIEGQQRTEEVTEVEGTADMNGTKSQATTRDSALLVANFSPVLLTQSTQTVPVELHTPARAQLDVAAAEQATVALRAEITEMRSKHARIVAAHSARTDEAQDRTEQQQQSTARAEADAADAKQANAALRAEINELKSKHARIVAAHSAATAEAHRLSHRLLTHVELDAYSHTRATSSGAENSPDDKETDHAPATCTTLSHEQDNGRRETVVAAGPSIGTTDGKRVGLQQTMADGGRSKTPPRG